MTRRAGRNFGGANPQPKDRCPVRVTAAFCRLLRLPGVRVRDLEFGEPTVTVTVALTRRRLVCPEPGCSYSTPSRYDTRPAPSRWRSPGPGRVAPGGESGASPSVLPGARGAPGGSALRPGRFPVHPGLRGPGGMAGHQLGQDSGIPAGAHRLGHRGAKVVRFSATTTMWGEPQGKKSPSSLLSRNSTPGQSDPIHELMGPTKPPIASDASTARGSTDPA